MEGQAYGAEAGTHAHYCRARSPGGSVLRPPAPCPVIAGGRGRDDLAGPEEPRPHLAVVAAFAEV